MSTNQVVCIKRPEPGLSTMFEDMYLNERLVDVTLSCLDGQLQAHKLVLAACSPYFSNLFEKLPNQFHYPVVVLKDMYIEDLRLIVDFMYRGELTLTQDKLLSLLKSAENLQIGGLCDSSKAVPLNKDSRNGVHPYNSATRHLDAKLKRLKRRPTQIGGQDNFTNDSNRLDNLEARIGLQQPERFLEQSMTTGDSLDDTNQVQAFSYMTDAASTRNLENNMNNHSSSFIQSNHHFTSANQHQMTNQLPSLPSTARSTLMQASATSHSMASSRGRVHPCNICWKTFREKANLKRHLQVHSQDRVIYACPDCNKTFSWKDNYIRHTKTAHHMNNVRTQP